MSSQQNQKINKQSSDTDNGKYSKRVYLYAGGSMKKLVKLYKRHIPPMMNGKKTRILFVPYALKDMKKRYQQVKKHFPEYVFKSLHNSKNPKLVLLKKHYDVIFVIGGNTFRLMRNLYDKSLIHPIRNAVLNYHKIYIGSSAGAVIAGPTIKTTTSIPIVNVPSLTQLLEYQSMLHKSSIEIDSVYQWYQNTQKIVNTLSSQDSELPNSTSQLCNKIIQLSIQNSDLSEKYQTYLKLITTINSYNQVLSHIQELSLQSNCLICMQHPVNLVLIPCGNTVDTGVAGCSG